MKSSVIAGVVLLGFISQILLVNASTDMMTDFDMTTDGDISPSPTIPDNGSSHMSITLLSSLLLAVLALYLR